MPLRMSFPTLWTEMRKQAMEMKAFLSRTFDICKLPISLNIHGELSSKTTFSSTKYYSFNFKSEFISKISTAHS